MLKVLQEWAALALAIVLGVILDIVFTTIVVRAVIRLGGMKGTLAWLLGKIIDR